MKSKSTRHASAPLKLNMYQILFLQKCKRKIYRVEAMAASAKSGEFSLCDSKKYKVILWW
jgi:hypothetical protein